MIPVINDDPNTSDLAHPQGVAKGYVERDYKLYPAEMFSAPSEMKLIPRTEWDARIDEQEEQQSSLEHIYLANGTSPIFTNLDQNGHGYCWSYSTAHVNMLTRARNNQPLVRLSAHAVAAIIKGGKDEGGWCGLSAKFQREVGIPSEEFWKTHSRDTRQDTQALRANAALHRVSEDWVDLTRGVYDQNLAFDQLATCLLQNTACAVDFNWWGHSVCAVRLVRVERGSYGVLILNSWANWGRHGLAVLQGSKMVPDGAVSFRVVGAAAA